jgi:hypothetical protein
MGLKDIYTIKQARYVAYGLQGERTFLLPLNEDTRILSGLTESVFTQIFPRLQIRFQMMLLRDYVEML